MGFDQCPRTTRTCFADFVLPEPPAFDDVDAFADFTPPPFDEPWPCQRPGSFKERVELIAWQRRYRDAMYPPRLPPLVNGKSTAPRTAPPRHTPPPAELRGLIDLYRRRRDAIAIDRGTDGEEAERQALNIVCHQYMKKFGGALEDAGRVLRPLTIGAMG